MISRKYRSVHKRSRSGEFYTIKISQFTSLPITVIAVIFPVETRFFPKFLQQIRAPSFFVFSTRSRVCDSDLRLLDRSSLLFLDDLLIARRQLGTRLGSLLLCQPLALARMSIIGPGLRR